MSLRLVLKSRCVRIAKPATFAAIFAIPILAGFAPLKSQSGSEAWARESLSPLAAAVPATIAPLVRDPRDTAPETAAAPEILDYFDFEAEAPSDLSAERASDLDAVASMTALATALATAPAIEAPMESEPAFTQRTVQVSRGDTLMKLLVEAGASRQDSYLAITALEEVYSPRSLRPGQEIQLAFVSADAAEEAEAERAAEDEVRLFSISLRPNRERDIQVTRIEEEGFAAIAVERPLERRINRATGNIESSLSAAAQNQKVPANVLVEAIRAFSYDVDFQRELQKGDDFELLFETYLDEDGELAKTGRLLYAALTLSGTRLELYDFEMADGRTDYFNAKGESVRKSLLRTPINGARLSSGFGMRKHPVLGYSKMHRGVDFAAPRGTPIYAAGDGVIKSAGRKGSYGKYVRIRHNSTYQTAYAHMHRIAKGIKKGKRVKQGQIIGYVGTTGRSTGPHLHYELIRNGKQISPRKVKFPSGEKLKGKELARFQEARREADLLRSPEAVQIVDASCGDGDNKTQVTNGDNGTC